MVDVVFNTFATFLIVVMVLCMFLWLFVTLFPETVRAMNDRLDKAMADRVRKA